MVLPEYVDGRQDDHPDLQRGTPGEEKTQNDLTRKGAADLPPSEDPPNPTIIVDMREFRSELPAILHKRGIDIEPATIEASVTLCLTKWALRLVPAGSDSAASVAGGRLHPDAGNLRGAKERQ